MSTRREVALHIWERLLFKPYLWGGDDFAGFDCSGYVIEGLKSGGVLPREGDWTAERLANEVFRTARRLLPGDLKPGCLLFWASGGRISHVEVVWRVLRDGTIITLGASGGGSKTDDIQAAVDGNAYVKARPARAEWSVALDPFG